MINNDNLKNYIIIRNKLYRINQGSELALLSNQLVPWQKTILEQDFGKTAFSKIEVVTDPLKLPTDIKDLYLLYLEREVLKWHQLL